MARLVVSVNLAFISVQNCCSYLYRVIAPLEAVALIVWWAVDLISNDAGDGEEWYTYGRETLVMTITQV